MALLCISPLTSATGNKSTAHRLLALLMATGAFTEGVLLDSNADDAASSVAALHATHAQPLALALAIHASRAGVHLLREQAPQSASRAAAPAGELWQQQPPCVVVLGGTDINHEVDDAAGPAAAAIARVFHRADVVVAFTQFMAARYQRFIERLCASGACEAPQLREKLRVIPQGVDVPPARLKQGPRLRAVLGLPPTARLLLLVASIREVKAPLLLMEAVAAWHARDGGSVHLVLVGPVLDEPLFAAVRAATGCASTFDAGGSCDGDGDGGAPTRSRFGGRRGLWYHPPVPRELLLSWLAHDADVLLNSSVSEGQSGAILEAMALGTPVVARANEGNASLITHGATGMLYAAPHEAVACCSVLLEDGARRAAIVAAARAACAASHSVRAEAAAWRCLLRDLGLPVQASEAS